MKIIESVAQKIHSTMKVSVVEEIGDLLYVSANAGDEWTDMRYFLFDEQRRLILEGTNALKAHDFLKAGGTMKQFMALTSLWPVDFDRLINDAESENSSRIKRIPREIEDHRQMIDQLERELVDRQGKITCSLCGRQSFRGELDKCPHCNF